ERFSSTPQQDGSHSFYDEPASQPYHYAATAYRYQPGWPYRQPKKPFMGAVLARGHYRGGLPSSWFTEPPPKGEDAYAEGDDSDPNVRLSSSIVNCPLRMDHEMIRMGKMRGEIL
ncbi:hypothetical protein C4K68_18505, partial [Pokkaliibacter plantistimulans]